MIRTRQVPPRPALVGVGNYSGPVFASIANLGGMTAAGLWLPMDVVRNQGGTSFSRAWVFYNSASATFELRIYIGAETSHSFVVTADNIAGNEAELIEGAVAGTPDYLTPVRCKIISCSANLSQLYLIVQ